MQNFIAWTTFVLVLTISVTSPGAQSSFDQANRNVAENNWQRLQTISEQSQPLMNQAMPQVLNPLSKVLKIRSESRASSKITE